MPKCKDPNEQGANGKKEKPGCNRATEKKKDIGIEGNITRDRDGVNSLLEAALAYAKRGWYVIPLHEPTVDGCSCGNPDCGNSAGKHPRIKNWQRACSRDPEVIRGWWEQWPEANVGIVAGISNRVVLDVDKKNDGFTSLTKLVEENGPLPKTVINLTGGGGHQYVFGYRGGKIGNRVGLLPGLDVRADAGCFVVPPSLHHSGKTYSWLQGQGPGDMEPAELPEWLLNLILQRSSTDKDSRDERKGPLFADNDFVPEGERNDHLASIGGYMRRRGLSLQAIQKALLEENQQKCRPPLADSEVVTIAESVCRYDPAPREFPLTDLGNAERFVHKHGQDLRFCPGLGGWIIFDGSRWCQDKTGEIYRRAGETVRAIRTDALNEVDGAKQNKLIRHAKSSERRGSIEAMIALARSINGMPVMPDEFDQDPFLLNVLNGTIDLRTGELREHNPADQITKLAPVEFDAKAQCPRWDSFLRRIFADSDELIRFVQRAFGYALTGDASEQCWFFLYGTGANGKTTLLNAIHSVLGDYASQAHADTFLAKRNSGPGNDLARLKGVRFVAVSEPDGSRGLAESILKSFTGQDTIVCRRLYQEFFEYRPEGKIFLCANHKPTVAGTDYGFWRRLRLIPFEVQIPESEQDPRLAEILKEEVSGILNWLLEGCLGWQREGLCPPVEVRDATAEYREESDPLTDFISDECAVEEGRRVAIQALYDRYTRYCRMHGQPPLSRNLFGRAMNGRGFERSRSGAGRITYYLGLELRLWPRQNSPEVPDQGEENFSQEDPLKNL
ncbi:MAG: phage/plasmid primase, P4 family [Desulfomonilaceae bacterium]